VKYKIKTRQFGELEFDEDVVYHFPDGLPGFEELNNFVIIEDNDTKPLKWLLSIEDPDVGFPILEIILIMPELCKEIPSLFQVEMDKTKLDFSSSTVFGVITLHRDTEPATINLKAPIIIDNAAKLGRQLILNSDKYSTEHQIK